MAYRRYKASTHPDVNGINEYLCSSAADIAKLPKLNIKGTQQLNDGYDDFNNTPCGYHSTAMVCDGNGTTVYILNPENNWVQM